MVQFVCLLVSRITPKVMDGFDQRKGSTLITGDTFLGGIFIRILHHCEVGHIGHMISLPIHNILHIGRSDGDGNAGFG